MATEKNPGLWYQMVEMVVNEGNMKQHYSVKKNMLKQDEQSETETP